MTDNLQTDQILSPRATRVINLSGEKIPPSSYAKIQDVDIDGFAELVKPDADGIDASLLVITTSSIIPDGATGVAYPAESGKLYVAQDPSGDIPANGDSFGTKEDEWFGEKDQSGFIVLGAQDGRVKLSPFRSRVLSVKRFFRGSKDPNAAEEFSFFKQLEVNRASTIGDTLQRNMFFMFTLADVTTPITSSTDFIFTLAGKFQSIIWAMASDQAMSVTWDIIAITQQVDVSGGPLTFDEIQALTGQSINSGGAKPIMTTSGTVAGGVASGVGMGRRNIGYDGSSPIHGFVLKPVTIALGATGVSRAQRIEDNTVEGKVI